MKPMGVMLIAIMVMLGTPTRGDAGVGTTLPIPARYQWNNNNGYCGECSIQTCALYFGTYASQYRIREIIDPTQAQDLWVGYHDDEALNALRLTFDEWNRAQATPQYQKYLAWAKNHLHQGHPVIITIWIRGGVYSDYDHIVPAFGYQSAYDWTTYHAGDTLSFYDNYEPDTYTRAFSTLWDTRAMNGNGASYEYCIPRDEDYGVAITGIRDDDHSTLPVRLSVDRQSEPNVSLGKSPVTLNATITVQSLTAGRNYLLLRYNGYQKVPTRNFAASAYNSAVSFKATGATRTLTDSFLSDSVVIYRCIPQGQPSAVSGPWRIYP